MLRLNIGLYSLMFLSHRRSNYLNYLSTLILIYYEDLVYLFIFFKHNFICCQQEHIISLICLDYMSLDHPNFSSYNPSYILVTFYFSLDNCM